MSHADHPANASHPLDAPITQATGLALLAKLGVTEAEGQAYLGMSSATDEEVSEAARVNLHAIGSALDEATAHAVETDPKIELGELGSNFEARANGVNIASSLAEKLETALNDIHGASRLDATTLQEVLGLVVPQIRARARVSQAVKKTYSSILAYWHARYPGRHPAHPATPAAPTTTPAAE